MTDTITAEAILTGVRETLSSPERWTQKDYAKDVNGGPTMIRSGNAVCWCLVGAIDKAEFDLVTNEDGTMRVMSRDERDEVDRFSKALYSALTVDDVTPHASDWNDVPTRTYEDVIALLDDIELKLEADK